MINRLKLLVSQGLHDSGIMVAIAWIAAESIGLHSVALAIVVFGCAIVVAAKSDKTAPAWAVLIVIVVAGCAVKLGLLT